MRPRFLLVCLLTALNSFLSTPSQGAETVSFYGYDDCIRLSNETVTVVLCPAAGGRVLEYARDGKNMLFLPPGNEGWTWQPDGPRGALDAGRFDIGPEKMVRRGKVLWMGSWDGEIIGDRTARLTSQFDELSGARLIREFELAETGTKLRCTQTIVNESDQPISLCHWSRTFAVGGGIAIVPRSPRGRFPNGYVMYEEGNRLQFKPEDAHIQYDDQKVLVTAPPAFPKLGFDSHAGWLGYLAPHDQLFVKRFATYPDRAYNEFAGLTISVWYPEGDRVELEPIGPAEELNPGQQAAFTEEWWLLDHPFPEDTAGIDYNAIQKLVTEQTRAPGRAGGNAIQSPELHDDHRVTFRLVAPAAAEVRVAVAGQSFPMNRNAEGLWSYTTQVMPAGIYEYTFRVDGSSMTDPRNRWLKKWLTCASLLEIPGSPPQLTEQQAVPRGAVHAHVYRSKTTGADRSVMIYTPPGYDPTADRTYPVVVLCHGFGDDQTAWTEVGRSHLIVDNLIAQEKIEPMIIVMPYGHPVPLAERAWSEDYRERNDQAMIADVVSDLLPMVERTYRMKTSREDRAIVGLSMGGGHSISGGLRYPDQFAWVGAFSAAAPQADLDQDYAGLSERLAEHPHRLFWIACGKDDFLVERNRSFNDQLNQRGIKHTYVETDGGHSWPVWRIYLPQFLEQIFR